MGSLHDEVREMYQGNVYQTGNGYLRPRHLVHLVDAMRQLAGPVEVKEVTHTFGMGGLHHDLDPRLRGDRDGHAEPYSDSVSTERGEL